MAVKTNGAEFKRFYGDKKYWPDGSDTYHDDIVFVVNGEELGEDQDPGKVADTDTITFEGGGVYNSQLYKEGAEPTVDAYFRRWKKEQTTVSIVIECDISKVDAIKVAVKAAGGKVVC